MATNISRPYSMDNYFNVVTDPNGKDILDPYTFLWTDFPYFLRNSQGLALRIDASLEGVPDLISWNNYGTHDLWWVIAIANQMVTPDTEIIPGMNMFVPSAGDISNFNQQLTARLQQGRLVSLRPGTLISSSLTGTAPSVPTSTFKLGQSTLGGSSTLG
jgi:hypothetical protein